MSTIMRFIRISVIAVCLALFAFMTPVSAESQIPSTARLRLTYRDGHIREGYSLIHTAVFAYNEEFHLAGTDILPRLQDVDNSQVHDHETLCWFDTYTIIPAIGAVMASDAYEVIDLRDLRRVEFIRWEGDLIAAVPRVDRILSR